MAAPLRKICFRQFHNRNKSVITLLSTQATDGVSGNQSDSSKQTHFGFQTIKEDEKEKKVHEVFENVASRYDVMNDAMSGGVHRLWKDSFISQLSPSPGIKLLDVAGGTGDIALRFLKYVNSKQPQPLSTDTDFEIPREVIAQVYMDPSEVSPSSSSSSESSSSESSDSDEEKSRTKGEHYQMKLDGNGSHVTVCDINQAMLDAGMKKATSLGYTEGINWVLGNAEELPLPDNTYDAYTIAFGIRNCTHVQKVLDEAYRVLKPGGRFMCLEFSQVKNPLLSRVYDRYSFDVIPVMGKVLAGDWKSYQYLVESIRQFPNQETFADMIKTSGFRLVSYRNLTFGVAAIHSGFKV